MLLVMQKVETFSAYLDFFSKVFLFPAVLFVSFSAMFFMFTQI